MFDENKNEHYDLSPIQDSNVDSYNEKDVAEEESCPVTSCEWDNEGQAIILESTQGTDTETHQIQKPKKEKRSGFRIFTAVVLSIFTLSVVALSAMVAMHLINDNKLPSNKPVNSSQNEVFPSINNGNSSESNSNNDTNHTNSQGNKYFTSNQYVLFDPSTIEGEILTVPQIASKCTPSSVGIISEIEVNYSYPFGFYSSSGVSEATGSGFIFSSDGYVITNHHVIEDAKNITVVLHDKTELEAELVGSDSLSDIAVLKVTPKEDTTLIPMEIGNSDELVVGESVVAIGCPAGIEFLGTVTDGIVSSINRDVEITDNLGNVKKTMTLIQTNATINHGNSGGPLINSRGQVIGINTLKLTADYEGIGFSIPMNGAMAIIKQLIEHGKVVERTTEDFAYGKGVIGITGSAISEDESEYYNIPLGILVIQIDKNSSAAKAGLRRGDIITHYNGKQVKTVDDINKQKENSRAGENATVTVYREDDKNSETFDITFTLDAQS